MDFAPYWNPILSWSKAVQNCSLVCLTSNPFWLAALIILNDKYFIQFRATCIFDGHFVTAEISTHGRWISIAIKFPPVLCNQVVRFYSLSLSSQNTEDTRVFNKIVLNRLNWNLKWLHDNNNNKKKEEKKWNVFFPPLTFKMMHSEAF